MRGARMFLALALLWATPAVAQDSYDSLMATAEAAADHSDNAKAEAAYRRALDLALEDLFPETMKHLFNGNPLEKLHEYRGLTETSFLVDVQRWADAKKPELRAWMRARGPMPDAPGIHAAVLAYVSDLLVTVAGVHPFDFRLMSPGVSSASLDHAMWFHEPVRMDEWIYAVHDSPVFKGSRVLGRALFYARDGRLVASAVQEGLVRNERWASAANVRHRPNV